MDREVFVREYVLRLPPLEKFDESISGNKLVEKLSKFVFFRKRNERKRIIWEGEVLGISEGKGCLDIMEKGGVRGSSYDIKVKFVYSGMNGEEIERYNSIFEDIGLIRE